jgi:tRNA uridine 5-carboxymethylaminomethyl modification enzyme
MFTSRAEHRLLLREDNAGVRLMEKGRDLGLVPRELWEELLERTRMVQQGLEELRQKRIRPDERVNQLIQSKGGAPLRSVITGEALLKRPEISIKDLMELGELEMAHEPWVAGQIEIETKYQGYIDRQNREVERFKKLERVRIPEGVEFRAIPGLTSEMREKLGEIRPQSLGQASRIPGMTPAGISALMIRLRRQGLVNPDPANN